MRLALLVLALGSTIAASGGVAVLAQPVAGLPTGVPSAPIGHLQPRAQPLSPQSAAEQVEQQKMSAFDAEQQKEDAELDKRLNICRGC
jgi:hypothetical protein